MDCENDNEMLGWRDEEYGIQEGMPDCLWDVTSRNEESFSYMFDGTTPIKACGDLAFHASNNEMLNKDMEQYRETSSQLKRRRMLHFDAEAVDTPFCNEEMPYTLTKPQETDTIGEVLVDMSEWVAGFAGCDGIDQSSEAWLADCLNDDEMHCSQDDINSSGACDVQVDIPEVCNTQPEYECNVVQEHPTRIRRNVVFKGRKSMQPPKKMASSVVYPFAFVKPCGFHGDVTLKDINQKIRTPPPSKSNKDKEDPSASYPTSAFSGKPVVGKTKIRTEGGKGSITIMRTKG